MRVFIQRVLLACLLIGISTIALADEEGLSERFSDSFESSCQKSLLEEAIREYSKASGVEINSISAEVRARVEKNAEPLLASCTCVRGKLRPKVTQESQARVGIELDMSGFMNAPECRPSFETVLKVRLGLMHMLKEISAPIQIMKTKRTAFSLEVATKMRPSLYASYQRPPAGLGRLVFLFQGTGLACRLRELCIDKGSIEISPVADFQAKHSWARAPLRRVIAQFGEDAQVITSGHNYTNFEHFRTADQFIYPIALIDGQPIELTRVRRLWLVIFNDLEEVDPRGNDFSPALASVFEVEFEDSE
jgi:hypothetical protein